MDKLQESVGLLRRMVAVPSVTYEEDAVCSLISSWLDGKGVAHKRFGNNIVAANVAAGNDAPVVLLDAHIDTVPAAASYTFDPFDAGDDPETVRGLGSNDDGGSVVSMIAVYRHFLETGCGFNLILALTCEEERSGCAGSAHLYSPDGPFASGEYPAPDLVIVGEPTGMKAATSERGLLVLDGKASGVSGHAARNEGVNALYIALEDIEALRSFKFTEHSDEMGDVKLTVTQIQAGTAHNVVPDSCSFVVDIRPTDKYDNAGILKDLQSVCRSTLTARNLTNKSSCTPAGSPVRRALSALGIGTFSSPTTSDWIRIPYPAVKIGPGESSRSHRADEFIKVSEIAEAVRIYIQLIDKYIGFYGNTME